MLKNSSHRFYECEKILLLCIRTFSFQKKLRNSPGYAKGVPFYSGDILKIAF